MTPEQARADERKAIVEWLMTEANTNNGQGLAISRIMMRVAKAIERGEHMKGQE